MLTTYNTPTDLIKQSFDELLTTNKPFDAALATILLTRMPAGSMINSLHHSWVESELRTRRFQLASASEEAPANEEATLTLGGLIGYVSVSDQLLIQPADGTPAFTVVVQSVNRTNGTCDVRQEGIASFLAVPAIATDAIVTNIGSAMYEGYRPEVREIGVPFRRDNYVQKFSSAFEITEDAKRQATNYGMTVQDYAMREATYNFSMDVTNTLYWGKRGFVNVIDPATNKPRKRTKMDGLFAFVPGNKRISIPYQGFNESKVPRILARLFNGTNGGRNRLALAGQDFLTALEEAGILAPGRFKAAESTLGLNVTNWDSTFGSVSFIYEPRFDEMGYQNTCLVLDIDGSPENPRNIELRPYSEMQVHNWDKSVTQLESELVEISQAMTLVARQAQSHSILTID